MDSRFNEIQQIALDAVATAAELPAAEILTTKEKNVTTITNSSIVGRWRLMLWIFCYMIFQHEKDMMANMKKFRPQNRENLIYEIKNFHDGLPFNWVWDDAEHTAGRYQYDLTGVNDADARKVIKQCAIRKGNDGRLVIKITGDGAPIANDAETRAQSYIDMILPPGTVWQLVNKEGDSLKFDLTAYVDPQIIDLTTGKLLNTDQNVKPVEVAVNSYLKNLEFNGAFVRAFFIDKCIDPTSGVKLVAANSIQWKYDAYPYTEIGNFQVPDAGWFKYLPADLTINYMPYEVVDL